MKKCSFALLVAASLTFLCSTVAAQEPGWSGNVIAVGPQRARIEATPIIYRNYRPFHFYGNTVRRRHYHGTALPRPNEFVRGPASLVVGR